MAEFVPWLVISLLTANGRVAPVTGSIAPTPVAAVPLRLANRPAATTWLPPPVTTSAITSLLPLVAAAPGTGAHGSSAPLDADTAASRVRLTEPTADRLPPRYTVELVAASAR